jgi:hypothetical protein
MPRSADARLEIYWPRPDDTIQVKMRVPLAAVPAAASFPQFGPGFLDFDRTRPLLNGAVDEWLARTLHLTVGGIRLGGTPRIVSNRLVLESEGAPVQNDTKVYWSQVVLESVFEYPRARPTGQADPRLAIDWRVSSENLRVQTLIEYRGDGSGPVRRFRYDGNIGAIPLNPSAGEVAARFAAAGFTMFLRDPDLLCLLAALLLPVGKRLRRAFSPVLLPFLLALPLGFAWSYFNGQPIWWPSFARFTLACVVFYAAAENAAYQRGWRWRWILAFAGGLIAGIALWLQFPEILQFAAGSDGIALASYVTGAVATTVVAGFTVAVALRWTAKWWFVRSAGSVLTAHQAWHSLLDNGATLMKYELWPSKTDTEFFAGLTKAAFALTASAAVAWLYGLVTRHSRVHSGKATHAR